MPLLQFQDLKVNLETQSCDHTNDVTVRSEDYAVPLDRLKTRLSSKL